MGHHLIQADHGATHNCPKPSFVDLFRQAGIGPAGMIPRDKDTRVVLVPRGQLRIEFRLDRPKSSVGKVHNTRYS